MTNTATAYPLRAISFAWIETPLPSLRPSRVVTSTRAKRARRSGRRRLEYVLFGVAKPIRCFCRSSGSELGVQHAQVEGASGPLEGLSGHRHLHRRRRCRARSRIGVRCNLDRNCRFVGWARSLGRKHGDLGRSIRELGQKSFDDALPSPHPARHLRSIEICRSVFGSIAFGAIAFGAHQIDPLVVDLR